MLIHQNRSMVLDKKQPLSEGTLISFRIPDDQMLKLRIEAAKANKSSVSKFLRAVIEELISKN